MESIKKRVLAVDDSPTKLELLAGILGGMDIELVKANSGREALKLLLEGEFAVILMDVLMPELSGFETAELIRRQDNSKETPIIFITAYQESELKSFAGYQVGAVDYLVTPIVPQVLKAKVKVFCEVYESRKRLEVVNAKLAEANKDLEAFAYSVSHDLRAPLRIIATYARLVQEKAGLKGEEAENLAVVIRNAAKLGDMVSGVLEYSRLGGRKECRAEGVDMLALAKSVIEEARALPGGDKAAFSVGPLPPGCGDETMLRQVLVNLVSNAVKFSAGSEKPLIELGGAEGRAENSYYVKDNGAGFDPAHADGLFTLFGRLHAPAEFEGLGLGLASVKRIITGHGGAIKAEGKAGHGVTITFTLPRAGLGEGTLLKD
ncbi:MAG: hypothetical protein AUJ51_06570 [Elusimicrobia bacterium CG1_02_56_21]|nr:MAG: hypothetical protein AUJ51_06570 [Elusimicrobia bacterium CG1_02_56_21]